MSWCSQVLEAVLDNVSGRGFLPWGRDLGKVKGWAYSIGTLWKGQNVRRVPSATEDCREKLCLSTYGSKRSVVLRPGSQ